MTGTGRRPGGRMRWAGVVTSLGVVASGGAAGEAGAQELPDPIPPPVVTVGAGLSRLAADEAELLPVASLRVELPVSRRFLLEPSLAFSGGGSGGGVPAPYGVLEVHGQLQTRVGAATQPYLSVGAGGFFDLRSDREGATWLVETLAAAAGVRHALAGGWRARGELRIRSVDGSAGRALEVTVGIGRTF